MLGGKGGGPRLREPCLQPRCRARRASPQWLCRHTWAGCHRSLPAGCRRRSPGRRTPAPRRAQRPGARGATLSRELVTPQVAKGCLGGAGSAGSQQQSQLFHLLLPLCSALPPFAPGSPPRTHPLQQFAFQEGFDHVVGRGEVPRLVDEVHGLEARWEGVLGCQTQMGTVTDRAGHVGPGEEVGSKRNPTLPPRPFPSLPLLF